MLEEDIRYITSFHKTFSQDGSIKAPHFSLSIAGLNQSQRIRLNMGNIVCWVHVLRIPFQKNVLSIQATSVEINMLVVAFYFIAARVLFAHFLFIFR
jgi:hypothetical protein